MSEKKLVSDCCFGPMYKASCYSSKQKKWMSEFWVCECCDNPCTPVEQSKKEQSE